MSDVLALIPARAGSRGIPGKNFRLLAGMMPYERAIHCAIQAGITQIVTSTDAVPALHQRKWQTPIEAPVSLRWVPRSKALAQDDTPMLAVVQDTLDIVPGPPDQIIVLLQPTQPLRQPKHVQAAIQMLRETEEAESVVSVTALPPTHHPEMVLVQSDFGRGLENWSQCCECLSHGWPLSFPPRRQAVSRAYIRDGTVYAFYRATVANRGNIYGKHAVPLIIPPEDTCPLDTPEDWAEAERRLATMPAPIAR